MINNQISVTSFTITVTEAIVNKVFESRFELGMRDSCVYIRDINSLGACDRGQRTCFQVL